ncbi:hypothetical protein HDV00_009916 [Rhizophlyctis rosea]|nr:hypothetical protein HDV00_009916 [Rhizophlyctis rosea]
MYEQISTAFHHLDQEVAAGRIKSYGICSHALANPSSPDHFDLSEVISVARSNGRKIDDNLVAVEFPFNLFEREAYEGSGGVMSAAVEHGLFPIAHRPLFAIAGGRVRSLSTKFGVTVEDEPSISADLATHLERMAHLEIDLSDKAGADPSFSPIIVKFVWGQVLAENIARLTQDLFAAQHYLEKQVMPALKKDVEELRAMGDEETADHVVALTLKMCKVSALRQNLDLLAQLRAQARALRARGLASDSLASVAALASASALDVVAKTPVDGRDSGGCVLVGMRQAGYAEELVKNVGCGARLDEDGLTELFNSWALQ